MRKILAVLDSDDTHLLIKQALSNGYEVIFCDSSDAKLLLQITCPDALILDLFLSGTDGLSLLRSLTDFRPPVIILLTSLFTDQIDLEASRRGVTDVLLKPCSLRHLSYKITEYLGK